MIFNVSTRHSGCLTAIQLSSRVEAQSVYTLFDQRPLPHSYLSSKIKHTERATRNTPLGMQREDHIMVIIIIIFSCGVRSRPHHCCRRTWTRSFSFHVFFSHFSSFVRTHYKISFVFFLFNFEFFFFSFIGFTTNGVIDLLNRTRISIPYAHMSVASGIYVMLNSTDRRPTVLDQPERQQQNRSEN